MAATKYGVVYETSTGIIRRVIAPDNDGQLAAANYCGPGESLAIMSGAAPVDVATIIADALSQLTIVLLPPQ